MKRKRFEFHKPFVAFFVILSHMSFPQQMKTRGCIHTHHNSLLAHHLIHIIPFERNLFGNCFFFVFFFSNQKKKK